MVDDVITRLLPVLPGSRYVGFNAFDVMHHGTHEKQLSNVFGWLLEKDGSHQLGDRFQRIFIDEVNTGRPGHEPFGSGPYLVRQEANTAIAGEGEDIADLVLEGDEARLVVENYFTSDGHGHSYHGYLEFSQRDGRRGGVVLLCRDQDSSSQTGGWEYASVVTYGALVDRLGGRGIVEPVRRQIVNPGDPVRGGPQGVESGDRVDIGRCGTQVVPGQ